MKKKVGFLGWRGMVGSVLLKRMKKKKDFKKIKSFFFTTSQVGQKSPNIKNVGNIFLYDAYDISILKELDIIVTCQGSAYTNTIFFKLRKICWKGYWIDASSTLRMNSDSIIVLDPINYNNILSGLNYGIKTFVGGNCTVSLMLLALGGLFQKKLIDWVSVSTYQAISGGGAKHLQELLLQIKYISKIIQKNEKYLEFSILELEHKILKSLFHNNFPKEYLKVPLVNSLIPWIDTLMKNGQSKEEWKGMAETNKILSSKKKIYIDGNCVRISSLRCHSQSFTIKLLKNVSISDIYTLIQEHNKWVKIIPNVPEETMQYLTPTFVSGTLKIPIGRIRKLNFGELYLSAFSVGDQLLWGAAEPLRRILKILIS